MKTIALLLMMAFSISVAQAKVYKCPGKVEGKYTYQEKPCKGAKADEHTIKIIPSDEQKVSEAQAKLARETNGNQGAQQPVAEGRTEDAGTQNKKPDVAAPPPAAPAPVAPQPAPAPAPVRPAPVNPMPHGVY